MRGGGVSWWKTGLCGAGGRAKRQWSEGEDRLPSRRRDYPEYGAGLLPLATPTRVFHAHHAADTDRLRPANANSAPVHGESANAKPKAAPGTAKQRNGIPGSFFPAHPHIVFACDSSASVAFVLACCLCCSHVMSTLNTSTNLAKSSTP